MSKRKCIKPIKLIELQSIFSFLIHIQFGVFVLQYWNNSILPIRTLSVHANILKCDVSQLTPSTHSRTMLYASQTSYCHAWVWLFVFHLFAVPRGRWGSKIQTSPAAHSQLPSQSIDLLMAICRRAYITRAKHPFRIWAMECMLKFWNTCKPFPTHHMAVLAYALCDLRWLPSSVVPWLLRMRSEIYYRYDHGVNKVKCKKHFQPK